MEVTAASLPATLVSWAVVSTLSRPAVSTPPVAGAAVSALVELGVAAGWGHGSPWARRRTERTRAMSSLGENGFDT